MVADHRVDRDLQRKRGQQRQRARDGTQRDQTADVAAEATRFGKQPAIEQQVAAHAPTPPARSAGRDVAWLGSASARSATLLRTALASKCVSAMARATSQWRR